MKYLLNFNNMSESLLAPFQELSNQEWNDFIKIIIPFDTTKLVILDGIKYEVRKTDQDDQYLDYVVAYIKDKTLFIYEVADEYYGIYGDRIRIKCDQAEGILQAINYLKSK